MKKQASLMEANATVGTCPDMCPEKERYRRQDTHRLSWFEARRDGETRVSHSTVSAPNPPCSIVLLINK